MEQLRREEVISLATDVSLGEVAHPSIGARGGFVRFLLKLIGLSRPGTLLFGMAPGTATLLLVWHGNGSVALVPALSAIGSPLLGLAAANALDLARPGGNTPQYGRAQAWVAALLLGLCAAAAGIPLALMSMTVVSWLAGGVALSVIGYVGTSQRIREGILGDLIIALIMGPVLTLLVLISQRWPLTVPVALTSLIFGCLALAIVRARRLRDLTQFFPSFADWPARWSIGALYLAVFVLLGYLALPLHAPHGALLGFIALPEAVLASHGALRASSTRARHLVVRATLGVAVRVALFLLLGLALNDTYLLMVRSVIDLWQHLFK